jgi:tRNA (uracil-5-)-methyltransferase TRM9
MKAETIRYLNDINRAFYQQTADHFDATRQHPWAGWDRLKPYLPPIAPLRVLDVGCGNGRFGAWLHAAHNARIHYHGVDNNPSLLDYARESLANLEQLHLTETDLVTGDLTSGTYDLIGVFGVIHHIPGAGNRRELLRKLADQLAVGGVLVWAAWRFYDYPHLRDRVRAWDQEHQCEPGDYLLDWRRGTVAIRYCHHVDDDEHDQLVRACRLNELIRFRADGRDDRMNMYSVLRKDSASNS